MRLKWPQNQMQQQFIQDYKLMTVHIYSYIIINTLYKMYMYVQNTAINCNFLLSKFLGGVCAAFTESVTRGVVCC